jgi:FkbM family methyltransferase
MILVRQKILIARFLNYFLRLWRALLGRDMGTICRRRGIMWQLDLNEGIDLSIYLLGAYEPRPLRSYTPLIGPGDVVLDIGANIGAHTLHFARLVGPTGQVHAFEPTDYAVAKLRRNLALNPELTLRVRVEQCFLGAESGAQAPAAVPASWPVGTWQDDLHWGHLGRNKTLGNARVMKADDYCAAVGLSRLRLVKIDVDGHEYDVLRGLRNTLRRFHPYVLIEIAPFIYENLAEDDFAEFVRFLAALDYDFTDANNGRVIPSDPAQLCRLIPRGGGINALLKPRRTRS